MNRREVADALEEIGVLLELKGENPFKTRAYANAARILRGLTDDLGTLVDEGRIDTVKGIGPALAEKIRTLVRDGRLPYLDELHASIPDGLLEWLRIPGLGPKKIRAIHDALGVETLGELEYACRENRLRELPGFGERSQQKILAGIGRVKRDQGRFLQPVVRDEAAALLAVVLAAPGVVRAEVCGSVRRRTETSKDIDIVVAAEAPGPVMDAFVSSDRVLQATGRGPTKCSALLAAGPSADLRVVGTAQFPFATLYFTGSKDHNVALRRRAQAKGLRLNEYALTRESDGSEIACGDEAAIYGALGLTYVEPELREDVGELESAELGALPCLVDRSDLVGVLHCHSTWSDGSDSIAAMAEAARARGFRYLGLCDHSKAAAYAGGLDAGRVRAQHEEIDAVNARFADELRVLKGIEVDILEDGSLDFPDEILATFDLVVASVHSRFTLAAEAQTRRVLRAIENPYVDVLGHPTGRLLLSRDAYPLDLERVVATAADRGVAIEINAHPARLDLDWRSVRYGLERGLKTAINPDAHSTDGLDTVDYGVGIARKGGCSADDVLNAWDIDRLTDWLRERRAAAGA